MAATRRQPNRAGAAQHRPQASGSTGPQRAQTQAISHRDALNDLMSEESQIVKIDPDALAAITTSEIQQQLDAAHRWPRSIERFRTEAAALATMTKATAKSCIYTLPVRKGGDKPIVGPSVRLAEMIATSWGNLHVGARVINEGHRDVTAQALSWDLEKNNRIGIEVKRGIVTKDGHRFGDDMIRVTSMAAISIALRNAIFRTVPRALVNEVYEKAERVATGVEDGTFEKERDEIVGFFVNRWNIPIERILARVGVAHKAELDQEMLAILIGLGQQIKGREMTIDEAFPGVGAAPAQRQQQRSRGAALDAMVDQHTGARKSEPPPANDAGGELTIEAVGNALAEADEAWEQASPALRATLIETWSPADRRRAHDWAVAFIDTPSDEPPPEQPEFTFLPQDREPGQEG